MITSHRRRYGVILAPNAHWDYISCNYFVLGFAESACRTGYYASGSSCKRCPTNCVRCTSSTRCSQCNTGHYGSHCQHSCRSHCTSCTADKNCQGCKTGYYGSYCHHSCPSGCLLQICRKSDGYCSEGCKDGYYMSSSKCKNCPSHCSRCSSSSICSVCKSGYWGTSCQYSCAHCTGSCSKTNGCYTGCTTGYYLSGGECYKCPSNCDRCSSPTHCTHCKTGHWGNTCQHTCVSCSGMCSKDTGCSGCFPGYYRHFVASKGGNDCLQCPTDCTACTDNAHCSACAINTFGSHCQYSCDGCKDTCDKTFGCTGTCSTGYYKYKVIVGSACEKCPSGCKTCSSSSECYDCIDGKWGSQCPTDCDINCELSACDKVTGICTNGCNTGYKQIGTTCIACPTDCADCQVSNVCSACRDRYYLSDNTCNQCPAGCESCTSSTLCTECITGQYGQPTCNNKCSIGCKDSVCDQTTGECTTGCLNTYYSVRCECTSSECTASSAVGVCSECSSDRWYPEGEGCCPCSQECKDNICYTNGTCKDCMTGRFGDFCENYCNSQCRNRECDRDGLCFSCIDGFYGDKCETTCHSAITDCEICHVQIGSKIVTCTECVAGKYPDQTSCKDCSENCKDDTFPKCNSATGVCKYGCKDNWSGPLCDIPCFVSRCELCDSADENVCLSCLDGFYADGPAACVECSKLCKLGTTCDRNNGLCTEGCESGWSGEKCDERCFNSNCLDCDQGNGNTCVSCVLGKFGETCDKPCNRNCKTHTDKQNCEKISGRCLFGCEEGYWGNICSETCQNCGNFLCNWETGECLSSCKTNFYGDSCEGKCSEHCNQKVMLVLDVPCDNTGKCYDGCKDHWWGDRCDTKCSDHCNQTDCSEEDGKCKFGCTGGYTGDQCIVGMFYFDFKGEFTCLPQFLDGRQLFMV